MKVFVFLFAIALVSITEATEAESKPPQSNSVEQVRGILTFRCSAWEVHIPSKWIDMVEPCVDAVEKHIQANIKAAYTYLMMGSHFYTDKINRRLVGEFFFITACEKRKVALELLRELLMRGSLSFDGSCFHICNNTMSTVHEWDNALEALKYSLHLETELTKALRHIINICRSNEKKVIDFNLVDRLSETFLFHQYSGERNFARQIATLGKISHTNGHLGEFMFDKTIFNADYNKQRKSLFETGLE